MTRITVTACDRCPLGSETEGGVRCNVDPAGRFSYFWTDEPQPPRPTWCPLDSGPVRVVTPAPGKEKTA